MAEVGDGLKSLREEAVGDGPKMSCMGWKKAAEVGNGPKSSKEVAEMGDGPKNSKLYTGSRLAEAEAGDKPWS